MIKKIFAISLILFFGFAGNVFAVVFPPESVYYSDTIGEHIEDWCWATGEYGHWLFWDSQNPTAKCVAISRCPICNPACNPSADTRLFGEVFGKETKKVFAVMVWDDFPAERCMNPEYPTWNYEYLHTVYIVNSLEITLISIPILTMPETASSDLLANVGGLFTDFWPIIAMMFGIPLAFYIIPRVIELVIVKDKP